MNSFKLYQITFFNFKVFNIKVLKNIQRIDDQSVEQLDSNQLQPVPSSEALGVMEPHKGLNGPATKSEGEGGG